MNVPDEDHSILEVNVFI